MPLLKLIDSRNGALQHNSAFAIYGLADNEVELIGLLFNLNFLNNLSLVNHPMLVNTITNFELLLKDNVVDLIKVGGVQKLQEGEFTVQVCFLLKNSKFNL